MQISFSPQLSDADLILSKNGDALSINGDVFDFSDLPEGGAYPPEAIENPLVIGGVSRSGGVIHITVILPYSNPTPPDAVAFPEPITVTRDGPIALPEGRFAEVDDAAE